MWQTIDSAPKDGTHFVGYHPAFANPFWIFFDPKQSRDGFTHWMPIAPVHETEMEKEQ